MVASGYTHEYEVERTGRAVPREEFVARRIGHDTARTRYSVDRPAAQRTEVDDPSPSAQRTSQAIGL